MSRTYQPTCHVAQDWRDAAAEGRFNQEARTSAPVAAQAASPRFEVYESGPVRLADGSDGGRRYRLAEVIDLSRPGEADRLREELDRDP